MDDNSTKQIEEVEALSSIYGDDWRTESDITRSYRIRIEDNKHEVILYVTMPTGYPSQAPPKYELSAPWMDRKSKQELHNALDEVYLVNIGETVIFQWVEKIREILQKIKPKEDKKKQVKNVPVEEVIDIAKMRRSTVLEVILATLLLSFIRYLQLEIKCPEIIHGEVIMDRKSSFQGHAAIVQSVQDVNAVIMKLKENKKILNATHNMYAYRIERKTDKGITILQDCDDDGETHAGGRMLHLLQILDQRNSLVVVSRWYGGIQLGPDRFRHINNATRQVLQQAGLLNNTK